MKFDQVIASCHNRHEPTLTVVKPAAETGPWNRKEYSRWPSGAVRVTEPDLQ